MVLTDLDGTILDKNYSFNEAKPFLDKLYFMGAQIIPVTSKTLEELLPLVHPLRFKSIYGGVILAPEDGSAIFYGRGRPNDSSFKLEGGIELAVKLEEIRGIIDNSVPSECKGKVVFFSRSEPDTIMEISGLDLDMALRASRRKFVEIAYTWDPVCKKTLYKRLVEAGLDVRWTWKYLHIGLRVGKERAVEYLRKAFSGEGYPLFACLGDSEADLSFLEICDYPIVIPRDETSISPRGWFIRAPFTAPRGFGWAVEKILLPSFFKLRKPSIRMFLENPVSILRGNSVNASSQYE